jgi:hypothetical protein
MRVKVIFPAINDGSRNDILKEFIWDSPGETDAEVLSATFREFNVVLEGDAHIARKCRSMSTGDIAICIDSLGERIYICEPIGWKLVDADTAKRWMEIPYRDRVFGHSEEKSNGNR